MNADGLANVLKHTYIGDDQQRRAAEAAIKKYERMQGYPGTLLQIVVMDRFPFPVRQSATILLKNMVVRHWTVKKKLHENSIVIGEKDRGVIKRNLLEAIVTQSRQQIRVQLLECLHQVCRTDFPKNYPFLLKEIMKNIHSKKPQRIYGALCALRQVFKNYHFRAEKDRRYLPTLVESTFPTLIQIITAVLKSKLNQDSYEMVRMLIKIFRIATYLSMPDYLKNPANLGPWMQALVKVVESPIVGVSNIPSDRKELTSIPQIKCKKWALRSFLNIHKRFGQEVLVSGPMKNFARMFDKTFNKPLLGAVLGVLKSMTKGAPVTDKMIQTCFQYVSSVINHAHLYQLVRPHLKFLLHEAVLGCLCLTPGDIRQWREDPAEYIRRESDLMEEYDDPRFTASEFLVELIRIRTKDALPLTMNTMTAIFKQYAQSPPDRRNYRQKEAAMRMLQSVAKLMLSQEKFYMFIEQTIQAHVLPEFKSNTGFMQARACAVVGAYIKLDYKNGDAFREAVQSVCRCLTSKELPLKLQAVKAMSRVVKSPEGVQHIKPWLKNVLAEYFKLIDDVPNEEVVETLEILVAHVKDEIGPFAVQIAQRMVKLFFKIITNASADEDENAFTALQCLRVLNTLLHVLAPLKDNAEVFRQLCMVYQPIIQRCLKPDTHEFLEDTLDLIGALVSFCSEMYPFLWALIPEITKRYKIATDHAQNVVVCLGKYVAYGGLAKKPDMVKEMLSMVHWTFHPSFPSGQGPTDPVVIARDMLVPSQYSAKLVTILLLHIGSKIQHHIPQISELVIKKLSETIKLQTALKKQPKDDVEYELAKAENLIILLIESMSAAMYRNPELFLQALSKMGCTTAVFKVWMSSREKMREMPSCLQLSILGLQSLSILPPSKLPKELMGSDRVLLHLLNASVGQLTELKAQEEKEANDGDTDDDGDDDDDDSEQEIEKFEDIDGNKDAICEADMEEFKGLAERIKNAFIYEDGAHRDEYLDEFFNEPLYQVDKFAFFARCFDVFPKANPQAYNAWKSVLNGQQKATIQKLAAEGKMRATEEQKGNQQ
mmetsp:Transcript_14565/g.24395  ORF Transcript_14565/g.24395 Transcript_14565/m.24395 type:complete len:1052 (+) Transcript_14565:145-3300(+)